MCNKIRMKEWDRRPHLKFVLSHNHSKEGMRVYNLYFTWTLVAHINSKIRKNCVCDQCYNCTKIKIEVLSKQKIIRQNARHWESRAYVVCMLRQNWKRQHTESTQWNTLKISPFFCCSAIWNLFFFCKLKKYRKLSPKLTLECKRI